MYFFAISFCFNFCLYVVGELCFSALENWPFVDVLSASSTLPSRHPRKGQEPAGAGSSDLRFHTHLQDLFSCFWCLAPGG